MNTFKKLSHNINFCLGKFNETSSQAQNRTQLINRSIYTFLSVTFFKIINLINASDQVNFKLPTSGFRLRVFIIN